MANLPQSIAERLGTLPEGLQEHIERARTVGQELAAVHHVDVNRVDFALATHDLARTLSGEELIAEAERLGIELSSVEMDAPVLVHGPIAAVWLEREEGVSEREILEAVRVHTTGRAAMGEIAKVVYLADKLDPSKISYYPFQPKLKELAVDSLDTAMLYFVDRQMEFLLERGLCIHVDSVALRNDLILSLGKQS